MEFIYEIKLYIIEWFDIYIWIMYCRKNPSIIHTALQRMQLYFESILFMRCVIMYMWLGKNVDQRDSHNNAYV